MPKLKHMSPVDPATFTPFTAWGMVISADEQAIRRLKHEKNRLYLLDLVDTYDYMYCMTGIYLLSLKMRNDEKCKK